MEPTKFDMKYAAVRRAIIEQRFSKLNDKQREAVYQTEGSAAHPGGCRQRQDDRAHQPHHQHSQVR